MPTTCESACSTDIGQMWQKVEERPETNMSCITEHPIQIVIMYVLQQ